MHIGKLDSITPTVNFASRATALSGTDWGVRIIPDYQLFYVISGIAELTLGQHNQQYTIRAGECIYFGSECTHKLTTVQSTDYFSIHFHWHYPSPIPIHPGHRIQNLEHGKSYGEPRNPTMEIPTYGDVVMPTKLSVSGLEPIMTKMVNEYELEQPGYALSLRGLMMQAISIIFRQLIGSRLEFQRYGRIDPAIKSMQEDPGRNWSVSELADLCGYHPTHFAKLFKEEVGVAPKHYIIGERIKRAKRALLQGERLDTISQTLGFTSIHYFSHQFKKITGLSPTEFRLQGQTRE
jgi:AraC-like DNA-binding protein